MAVDRERDQRNKFAVVLLALQALARQGRSASAQKRIAQLGLNAARRLIASVLNGGGQGRNGT
jgi:hypothetical protein